MNLFPNISNIFRIYLAIPISSANMERSFSVLKRLNNFLRNSMTQHRLADLCMINIEPEEVPKIRFKQTVNLMKY